jgi:predicted permease
MTRKPPAWRRYLRFWGSDVEDDVNDELAFHVEMRVTEYVARGMPIEEARRRAIARFGDTRSAANECVEIGRANERQARRASLIDSAWSDIRFAARTFARTPAWTAVALVTMAIGIGASATVLSVVDALLLRPIAYPSSSRVASIRLDVPFPGGAHAWAVPTPGMLDAWRQSANAIESVEGYARRELALASAPEAAPIHAAAISDRFLTFAGAAPILGRSFSADDGVAGAPTVVILAEPYWQRAFGGARDVLGKSIRANGLTLTIIGVLPASLRLPDLAVDPVDIWLPMGSGQDQRLAGAVARLRPGTSTKAAEGELGAILKRLTSTEPFAAAGATPQLLRPSETLGFRRALEMLTIAVALLLVVACTNVSHLSLARGVSRQRELAVRFALGAGRGRLVRQLLTESLLLSIAGGFVASCVGSGGLALLRALHPPTLAALGTVRIDRSVFVIAAALTSIAGVAIGMLVGNRVARDGIASVLRLGAGSPRHGARLRSMLVVSEIALSATLLVGALLLVRSVMRLQAVSPGLDTRGLYAMTIPLRGTQLESVEAKAGFARRVSERARAIPGVTAATLSEANPFRTGFIMGALETADQASGRTDPTMTATNPVSPDYFSVVGIPIVAGSTFDVGSADRNEVIVDETLAKRLWPAESAVGKRFRVAASSPSGTPDPWWTVIGVARKALGHGLMDDDPSPTLYSPIGRAFERGRITLITRWRDGQTAAPALRRLAAELATGAPPPPVTSLQEFLNDSIAEPRFAMVVLGTFAAVAVLLAGVGLYGVISYSVTQRTREIGIRMTLGATHRSIAGLVIADGLRLSSAGILLGVVGAAGASRLVQVAIYGVGRSDPVSFAVGSAGLLAVSLVACAVPVMRATAVDPAVAVRAE